MRFRRNVVKNALTEISNNEVTYIPVAEAGNGLEAINRYKEHNPDIVTMDITMPSFDGLYGLAEIKKYNSKAVVIMCSAMGQQNKIVEAAKLGAKDFVVKPFDKERLKAALVKGTM